MAELESQLAAAKKNSRNSSKPPSSDITRPSAGDSRAGSGRKKSGRKNAKLADSRDMSGTSGLLFRRTTLMRPSNITFRNVLIVVMR